MTIKEFKEEMLNEKDYEYVHEILSIDWLKEKQNDTTRME